jgi:hypothetical protein
VRGLEDIPVPAVAGAPEVRLLDARARGCDERGLRDWARARTDACGSPHVVRSYRYPYALVAWHSEPIGVDIERIEPCDAAFADLICTTRERADALLQSEPDAYLTSLWCSKEALSKALGDALRYDPGRLDSPMRWPELRSGPWRAASLRTIPGHTAWLCWRVCAADGEPASPSASPGAEHRRRRAPARRPERWP